MKTSALLAAAALLLASSHAGAEQMRLQIENGLVSLDAQNVPVRQILAEWARVGGARIVNGEKVAGGPVTLQLNGVPERQAIDTILRGVSGYMLAARPAGDAGVSAFDRILILPTSSAPRGHAAPVTAGFQGARPMPQQSAEPVPTDVVEDGDSDEPEPPDTDGAEVVQQQPGLDPRFQRRPNVFPNPLGGQIQPFVPQPPGEGQQIQGQPPTATNPFGMPPGSTTTPGVATPVPRPDQQQTPPRRPPL